MSSQAFQKCLLMKTVSYTHLDVYKRQLFRDIDKNTVDFVPNYDNTMLEPTLFPATFPSILVNNNRCV